MPTQPIPGNPDPAAVVIFRALVVAYEAGDMRGAAALTKRLRGVGYVVRPLPNARGQLAPIEPDPAPSGPPIRRLGRRPLVPAGA